MADIKHIDAHIWTGTARSEVLLPAYMDGCRRARVSLDDRPDTPSGDVSPVGAEGIL